VTAGRVSVVIIFLNAERFLGEAIESVTTQTYPDWELLLVDDGSDDSSTSLARRAAAAAPDRVHFLEHPDHRNRGMSASRNLGAAHATGPYITFLDADDVLLPDALETLVRALEAEPRAAMAYGPLEHWYSWAGVEEQRSNFVRPLGVPVPAVLEPPELLLRFLRRRAAAPSGVMIRTAVLREIGGFEDEFRGMYEDQAFCAKVCLRWPVLTTGSCGYRYRQHEGSSSARADGSGQYEFGREAFLCWLDAYLVAQGMEAGLVAKAVQRELWWLQHPRLQRFARRLRRVRQRLAVRLQRLSVRTQRGRSVIRPAHPALRKSQEARGRGAPR
jgi:glycosyltransferase involved in cell wall biosynthesis